MFSLKVTEIFKSYVGKEQQRHPLDIEHKLNVHKTFRASSERLIYLKEVEMCGKKRATSQRNSNSTIETLEKGVKHVQS